ncbi:MAG: helix-turn-helix transcriptional regulator [Candidatus Thiodiazotropha sp.]
MSTPNESTFQSRLQSTRKQRDLNQEELANKAGLPSTAISHFESGSRKPSFDNLHKLAEALKVSIDYLMGRTDDMDGSLIQEAQIFRDYGKLTDDDRALADDFMARLAKRNPDK